MTNGQKLRAFFNRKSTRAVLLLLLLSGLTAWVHSRWSAWFSNPPEAPYTVSDVHHIFFAAPLLRGFKHLFEKFLFAHREELEIKGAFVGGEGEEDDPFAIINGEGLHRVGTHVGGYGHGVKVEIALGVEEGFGVLLRGVAYVATFCIGYGEGGLAQAVEVIHGLRILFAVARREPPRVAKFPPTSPSSMPRRD